MEIKSEPLACRQAYEILGTKKLLYLGGSDEKKMSLYNFISHPFRFSGCKIFAGS
jgi:hypothetical protein